MSEPEFPNPPPRCDRCGKAPVDCDGPGTPNMSGWRTILEMKESSGGQWELCAACFNALCHWLYLGVAKDG